MAKVWNQASMRMRSYAPKRTRKMHGPVNGGEDAKLELRRPEAVPWYDPSSDFAKEQRSQTLFQQLAEPYRRVGSTDICGRHGCDPKVCGCISYFDASQLSIKTDAVGCMCDECKAFRTKMFGYEPYAQAVTCPCGHGLCDTCLGKVPR
jgi:hypothetical protein